MNPSKEQLAHGFGKFGIPKNILEAVNAGLQESLSMSHPPVLAVAIVGVLAVATIAETWRVANLPKPPATRKAAIALTPAHQLSRALQALRDDIESDGTPAM
jgi:hypothetical protein